MSNIKKKISWLVKNKILFEKEINKISLKLERIVLSRKKKKWIDDYFSARVKNSKKRKKKKKKKITF